MGSEMCIRDSAQGAITFGQSTGTTLAKLFEDCPPELKELIAQTSPSSQISYCSESRLLIVRTQGSPDDHQAVDPSLFFPSLPPSPPSSPSASLSSLPTVDDLEDEALFSPYGETLPPHLTDKEADPHQDLTSGVARRPTPLQSPQALAALLMMLSLIHI